MIIEVFIIFLAIAIFLMVYGYNTNELSWAVVGCIIFFMLSGWVLFGKYTAPIGDTNGLQYKTGVNVTIVSASNTLVEDIYSSYNDVTTFWMGLFLTLIAGLGVILIPLNNRKQKVNK